MALRVLVVDDYEPFRRVVRLILQLRDDLQIVGEASDGLEAIQKAKELRPDVILLDVGLPTLNGIQVARRLCDLVPRAKILFLSVESSSDVVREAFNVGAVGYVHKLHVQGELLPGIEIVLKGKHFVGSGLEDELRPSTVAQSRPSHHEMLVYSDDAVLLESFTRFIGVALRADNPVIMASTQSHLDSVLQSLNKEGLDAHAAIERGAFIPLNASDKLSNCMVNDLLDRFR